MASTVVKESPSVYQVSILLSDFEAGDEAGGNPEIILESKNIKSLYFIEDIFSYFMCGKITFIDKNLLGEFGPITGNEKLRIVYGVNEQEKKEITFSIYKISDINQYSFSKPVESQMYTFYFIEHDSFEFNDREFSTSWAATPITDVVKDILTNMCELSPDDPDTFVQFENGNPANKIDFCMPYWTPRQTIDWLLRRTSGEKSNNSGYLLYSNTKNRKYGGTTKSMNMVTLDTLLSQTDLMKLGDGDDGRYVFIDEDPNLLTKILSYTISGPDRTPLYKLRGGRKLGFDNIAGVFLDTSTELDFKSMVEKTTILGKTTLFSDISQHTYTTDLEWDPDMAFLRNIYYDEWVKRYVNQNVAEITVNGHENRYAGGMIEIDWDSAAKGAEGATETDNRLYSGRWLVRSITHYFTEGNPYYTQKLVLIKNGYEVKPTRATYLMDSSNQNLKGSSAVYRDPNVGTSAGSGSAHSGSGGSEDPGSGGGAGGGQQTPGPVSKSGDKRFACKHCGETYDDPVSIAAFDRLQQMWGKTIIVNSAHRCVSHNASVGGAKASQHLKIAFDCRCPKADQDKFVQCAKAAGFRGIGRYGTFVHVDMGPAREWKGKY